MTKDNKDQPVNTKFIVGYNTEKVVVINLEYMKISKNTYFAKEDIKNESNDLILESILQVSIRQNENKNQPNSFRCMIAAKK